MRAWITSTCPSPISVRRRVVIQAGELSLRTRFEDYTGLFVMHCHRLNHEDNGLMMLVNVIPAVSSYALSVPDRGQGRRRSGSWTRTATSVATVTPFPGYEGTLSTAMGDVDDDGVYDLVVGAGAGHAPEVVVLSGQRTAAGRF